LVVTSAVIGAYSTSGIGTEASDIRVVVSAHVVRGITAIKLEGVLVAGSPAYVPVDVLTRLQNSQRRGVAADIRQVDQRLPAEARADRSVHRLQLGANRHGNLDSL